MLKKFIKDVAIYAPSQFLPALTAFITTPILARLFTPDEYGYWALATSIIAFLVAMAVSGYAATVIRFYPAYKFKLTLHIFFTTLSISAGSVIFAAAAGSFLILILLRKFLPDKLYHLLPLIIAIFITQSVFSIFIAVIRAQERSGTFTTFQLIQRYGELGIGLVFVLVLGLGVEGLLYGSLISVVLTLPILIFLAAKGVPIHPKYFRFPDATQIWQYAWPLTLGNIAMWALRVSDLFIIGYFRLEREVGLYSISYNISSKSIELLVALLLLSMGPMVMRTWENEGQAATEKALTMVTRVYLILCLPAVVGLSVLAFPFVALLTAPDYYEGYRIVGLVVFSSFIWGLSSIALMGTAIKKQTRLLGLNQIIAASVHIGLQLLLVPSFGYMASAISTLVGYIILLILQALASRPHLTWLFPFKTLRNVFAASACMGLVVWKVYALSMATNNVHIGFLLLSIVVAIPVYFLSLLIVGEADESEISKLKHFWLRITSGESG